MTTNQINSGVAVGVPPSLSDAPTPKEKPFSPDNALNEFLNSAVDRIFDLGSVTLSMNNMMTAIQKTSVKNGQSKTEMIGKLLSAQGVGANSTVYDNLIKSWGNPAVRNAWISDNGGDVIEAFMSCCRSFGMDGFYENVYNNPNITDEDKVEFTSQVAAWGDTPNLSTFIGKSSVISQQLTLSSTYVQDWQSLAESMKPTTIQQAITTLIAEIGQFTSMWTSVIAS
jgi:hypothetical protein